MSKIYVTSSNEMLFEGKTYRCAIGEKGFTDTPAEGDKATPLGTFPLRGCWYRADKIDKPVTALPLHAIDENDGWCDDPRHPDYNKPVKLPFQASHERLWREDATYDIVIPIGFNDAPITPGKGSAIFFHIARPDYTPTLGCIAVSLPDMLEILCKTTSETTIEINPPVDA